jgi:uncharacterized protein YndB with AHSA1/START domain
MVATNRFKLSVSLPWDCEILMTRVFDAPRELVFDAWTKPEHITRWLYGPDGWSMPVCEVDLRPGGQWRYILEGPAGEKMGMKGEYREISRPGRLTSADVFDDFADVAGEVMPWPASPEGEAVSTMTLAEQDGTTTYTNTFRYRSMEARDAALATGMDQGMAVGFDRLSEYLQTLRPAEGRS